MTHDELLVELTNADPVYARATLYSALRAVVELHKPYDSILGETYCVICDEDWDIPAPYPCPTIQAIEKELG